MRDAPSIAIVQALIDAGAEIVAYDPEGMEAAASLMPQVAMAANAYDAVTGADAVVLVTEWDAFRGIDLERVGQLMNSRVLVDLRNVYNPAEVRASGWHYSSVGRK
jgi:UDPglucose 6-dehydrogenase